MKTEDARGRAGMLVAHVADAVRDSPDAEYVRGKVACTVAQPPDHGAKFGTPNNGEGWM